MIKKYFMMVMALAVVLSSAGCGKVPAGNVDNTYGDAAKVLIEVKTTQFFTDDKVADEDIEKILAAGVNAPSAMNTQPWHFTAVTDDETTQKLADAMKNMKPPAMKDGAPGKPPADFPTDGKKPFDNMPKDAPKPPKGGKGFSKAPNKAGIGDAPLTIVVSCKKGSEFDAGLAVQNMSSEAHLLGYGTKIMTAPTMALNNDEYKTLLDIPQDHKISAVLIVGKVDQNENYDVVSSASVRNDFDDVVTIK